MNGISISKEQVSLYYDNLTERQLKAGVNERHFKILKFLIDNGLKREMSVLEIGCGVGTLSELLMKYLNQGSLISLDVSPRSIEIAKKKFAKFRNVDFIAVDINEWLTDTKFDFIVLPDVLEHIPFEYHKSLFLKLKQLLKVNGVILIHIPNPYFLDYCRTVGMPMQVVDQAVYLPILVDNLKDSGLYISLLQIYSIWQFEGDYQVVLLRHEEEFKHFNQKNDKPTIIRRVIQKIKFEIYKILNKTNE